MRIFDFLSHVAAEALGQLPASLVPPNTTEKVVGSCAPARQPRTPGWPHHSHHSSPRFPYHLGEQVESRRVETPTPCRAGELHRFHKAGKNCGILSSPQNLNDALPATKTLIFNAQATQGSIPIQRGKEEHQHVEHCGS